MTRTKLDTPAFADQSVDSRNIADGTIQAQDISGSITGTQLAGSIANDKLVNNKFTVSGNENSLGRSTSIGILVNWQAVTVADGSTTLTAEAGKGYFLDTNTGVIEVFLPSSPNRGDVIILADYSGTFSTNKVIINTSGQLIDSTSGPDFKLTTNNTIAQLVYVDSNKGWLVQLNQAAGSTPDAIITPGQYDNKFIVATGGTVTESGNFKIHQFTGDGNFIVSSAGQGTAAHPSIVDYVVVAGGAGGGKGNGSNAGGGGGAGGFRESLAASSPTHTGDAYTTSPLKTTTGITVTATTFPISVGAGGAAGLASGPGLGGSGSNSVFSTITSAGGGGGGGGHPLPGPCTAASGGSGGGTRGSTPNCRVAGNGNTPPVSPPQGNPGGSPGPSSPGDLGGGGGGGASAAGGAGTPNYNHGGDGGAGVTSHITGSPVTRAGGGGGGALGCGAPSDHPGRSSGGSGGGGAGGSGPYPNGNPKVDSVAGTANTGGGGGGAGGSSSPGGLASAGGKGIVIIRYRFK